MQRPIAVPAMETIQLRVKLPADLGVVAELDSKLSNDEFIAKVREFLKGKKARITAAIGLLGAVVAWGDWSS